MPYCVEADITNLELTDNELIALTDDEGRSHVHAGRLAAAIEKAGDEIDGFCRERYVVPFNPVPKEIKFLAATIAAYWLYRRRKKVTESILDKYAKALAKLKRIGEGNFVLAGATQIDTGAIGSTTDPNAAHEFTRSVKDVSGNLIGKKGSMEIW